MLDEAADAYAQIAEWYDVEHDPITEDIECCNELIEEYADLAGSRGRVLEIGSGTGRVAAGLALAGHTVTGIEPSEAMRARAAKRLAALPERVASRIHLRPGSATALGAAADEHFDTVIFSLNTFAHLTSSEERGQALSACLERLRPAGQIILDLDLAGPRRLAESVGHLWWQGTWPVAESALLVSHLVVATPPMEPGIVTIRHFYDAHEQGGALRRTTTVMSLALLSRGEVELALRLAGFEGVVVYGSYELAPYDDATAHAIITARRPVEPGAE